MAHGFVALFTISRWGSRRSTSGDYELKRQHRILSETKSSCSIWAFENPQLVADEIRKILVQRHQGNDLSPSCGTHHNG